ncbi:MULTISPECIES: transcription antitermination factor NusB [unclassified Thermotoga]|uniref:transcription antitermination factor NusB n=1 Tax=unclassified Thermotoga TaxID=2631113 RepID=UPI000542B0A9|nr:MULTISPECIES: transcription antitermination factor NusB [unclassified Thermotoga]KAF2960684.1 N utilization substance protein B [Thermotoga sp. 38H-to]KHC92320.1 transcription antitermination protein NusB [Thermotoga sp. Mc24]
MKTPRRRMRLAVFKALFQHEFRRDEDLEQILEEILDETYDKKAKEDAQRYIKGIKENLPMIDDLISRYLEKWSLNRLSVVDRNVLRLATYELLFEKDIPIEVTIDEAIEIAKRYGTENSGKFVNGILDRIAKEHAPKEKFEL